MSENNFFNKKITFLNMFDTFIKRWYLVLSIMVVTICVSVGYIVINVAPTFSTTAKLLIINKEVLSSAEITVSTYLVKDFQEIIYDENTMLEISEELDNKYSTSDIRNSITVSNPEQTRVIELTVVSSDSYFSRNVIDSLCNILPDKAIEIMGVDRVSIISRGKVTTVDTTKTKFNIIVIGISIGAALSILLIFILTFFNNKISTEKEITEALELNVLATIPYNTKKGKH